MKHIGEHMASPGDRKRDNATERGELMKYFMDRLNQSRTRDGLPPLTMGRMARLCMAMPTNDLYYLKSICDQAKDFSKKFWWEINPKKHTQEEQAKRAATPKTYPKKTNRNTDDYY